MISSPGIASCQFHLLTVIIIIVLEESPFIRPRCPPWWPLEKHPYRSELFPHWSTIIYYSMSSAPACKYGPLDARILLCHELIIKVDWDSSFPRKLISGILLAECTEMIWWVEWLWWTRCWLLWWHETQKTSCNMFQRSGFYCQRKGGVGSQKLGKCFLSTSYKQQFGQ